MTSSTSRVSTVLLVALVSFAHACGGDDASPLDAGRDGAVVDAGQALDGGSPSDAGSARDGAVAMPFEVPPETWTAVQTEGIRCGNGSPMPIALNVTTRSTRVVVFMQGGGACWDAATCFGLRSAVNIDTTLSNEAVVAQATSTTSTLFSRDSAMSPFADASFVYLPYCTGDLHAGRTEATYEWLAMTHTVAHVGAENVERLLARLVPTFVAPERITLIGVSAGGYGVTLNWWRFRDAFPGVQIDVINDSGPPIDFGGDRWPAMRAGWALEMPPECTDCDAGFSGLLPHYAGTVPDGRYALLSYHDDATIALYAGFGIDVVRTRLNSLRAEAGETQYTFFVTGTSHVVFANPAVATTEGTTAASWVSAFATDAAEFNHAGP